MNLLVLRLSVAGTRPFFVLRLGVGVFLVVLDAAARGKLYLRLDQLPDGATGVEARWVFGAVILVGLGVIPSLGLPVDANR